MTTSSGNVHSAEPPWYEAWRASWRGIENTARGWALSYIDPDDLIQEAFLYMIKRFPSGTPPPDDLSAYLKQLFRNLVLKSLEARSREQSLPESGVIDASAAAPSARLEMYEQLRKSLRLICPQDRRVIYQHYIRGLTYRELASVMQLPEGTIKSRISRALDRVRGNSSGDSPA